MKKTNSNNTNFWISYADLMAGLLFVFILLMGAIIVKYSLLEDESGALEEDLITQKIALNKSKEELNKKEIEIENTLIQLEKAKITIDDVHHKLKFNNDILKKTMIENEELRSFIFKNKEIIAAQQEQLYTKEEIVKEFLSLLKVNELTLKKEKEKSDDLIKSLELTKVSIEDKNKKINKLVDELLLKENLIKSFKQTNEELDAQIKILITQALLTENRQKAYDKELLSTKRKIKNLTGMKIKVITTLKKSLGKDMKIDPNNGSITLSSNVLFDEDDYTLKNESKKALEDSVYNYFNTILENKEINQHIDKIVVEGHTNTKGSFLYNLNLSQKRAYAVMDFLLSLNFKKKEKLKQLLVASGRSFLDPIYKNNNIEDKEGSRRIEIKFRLKNEQAIKEIEAILDNNFQTIE